MRIYDVSLALSPSLPVWPGDPRAEVRRTKSLAAGDTVNCSHLSCNVHAGTHVDAPAHFVAGGTTVEQMSLDDLIGPAQVAHLLDVSEITPAVLDSAHVEEGIPRLLLRTRNSDHWVRGSTDFDPDFVALTPPAAAWIVARGIRLVGIDYLGIQRYHDPDPATHRILLKAGVVIIEGLDLHHVPPGRYQLICLPIKLLGAEGAPARTILIEEDRA